MCKASSPSLAGFIAQPVNYLSTGSALERARQRNIEDLIVMGGYDYAIARRLQLLCRDQFKDGMTLQEIVDKVKEKMPHG